MKILYFSNMVEDYLSDNIFYGLRKKLGADVIDLPKKEIMYRNYESKKEVYGNGFTMWKLLEDIKVDRENNYEKMKNNEYDYVFFSSIYRQQLYLAMFTNEGLFKNLKSKFVFLDGEDDGFPTVYDAIQFGTYFKRENPYNYKGINIIGLSIPAEKIQEKPEPKTRLFSTHVQCIEAFKVNWIAENCTNQKVFTKEEDYYKDLSISRYGITMKKSGWDTPRHMENAAHYVVNCIYQGDKKPKDVHPFGFVDMENCILWNTPEELINKLQQVEKGNIYDRLSTASHEWVKTKTCEKMTDYVLSKI